MSNTATERQISFIKSLQSQRVVDPDLLRISRDLWRAQAFTKEAASALIDEMLSCPKAADAPLGVHSLGGEVYRVKQAKESGNRYAQRLAEIAPGTWRFEYAPGAVQRLTSATLIATDEAADFGHKTGVCCNCAARLTDPRSVEAGYGPVCASNNGWAWG